MAKGIGEICSREVVVAGGDTTVAAAAKLMREHHAGSIVVCEPRDGGARVPVGIVTDRDLVVEVLAAGLDPSTVTVGEIMERTLVTAPEGEGVLEALRRMRGKGVRRLPVVGAGGELIGIVTLDDFLEIMAEAAGAIASIVRRERSHEASARR